ncbi:MAG: ATP-binding cassette domain-containing protein [Infirmifilum sp.]|uniref:ATP-binding cassette domain-containing protein n=1 Tax=Infirmifilum TaxID=2856573 RepID=UPI003C74DE09
MSSDALVLIYTQQKFISPNKWKTWVQVFLELRVERLTASVDSSEIVKDIDLLLRSGEIVLLLGPNGAGKTTLLSAIAGLPRVHVSRGRILLGGEDVTPLPAYERAKKGIVLSYQIPPELTGVKVSRLAKLIAERMGGEDLIGALSNILEIDYLFEREAFRGFSGGERKRVEVFLTALTRPRFALLDEPDSGVDLDSIKLIAEAIRFMVEELRTGMLIVTHTRILAERVGVEAHGVVLKEGRIACSGRASELLELLEERGFDGVCGG